MCTLSIVPSSSTRPARVVINRDERLTRACAWPPRVMERDQVRTVWPTDADSLGTWVAASDFGVVLALLNLHEPEPKRPCSAAISRGQVIPWLITARDLREVESRLHTLPVPALRPFRLIAVQDDVMIVCRWNGFDAAVNRASLAAPCIFSSSSLGDALVEQPRRELFDAILASEPDQWRAQDRLHQHAWPDRRHMSVMMSRTTARTVSRTAVTLHAAVVNLSYAPVIDGWIGPVVEKEIARRHVRAAGCA